MWGKLDTCENKEAGLRGTVEDSRWEKWKQEKIRDGKGERLSVQGAGTFWKEKDDRRRARRVRTRVCKTENEVGDGKKEERE